VTVLATPALATPVLANAVLAKAASSPSVWDQPGTLGFLVVFGMAVVLYFVFRSMAKQLRKVREAARIEAEQAEKAEAEGKARQQSPDAFTDAAVFERPAGNGSSHTS
jgi:hypothetical protein